jgi:murein DD-endopeptidase MepM/ murein hydrolase activator NlpD
VDTVVLVDTVVRVDTVEGRASGERMETIIGSGPGDAGDTLPVNEADLSYLRGRRLLIPVVGVRASELPNTFDESRAAGARRHDAIDILAARGTPVLSVDHGRIARIDTSDRGGLSLYATDPSGRYVYYYAHLDRYRAGLRDGQALARGDTIGYVGTTGNAPVNTPHLHFAISRLGDPKRWWDGVPINPWPLLTAAP